MTTTAIPSRTARESGVPSGPLGVVRCLWQHRRLVVRLARRDVLARYRGSLLGLLWSLLTPLLLLAAFTFVFNGVLPARWNAPRQGNSDFALTLFAGLIVFWLLSDCLNRAPGLLLENASYIKRVVFPLEILPWVVLLSALFHTAVSTGVLLAAHLVLRGLPPATAPLLPLVLLPVALFALGATWLLASLGVFLRDLRQLTPVLTMLLLFLSGVFYPLEAVPLPARAWLYLSPLSLPIEEARAVLLWGELPRWPQLGLSLVCGWLAAWVGLWWFARTRKGFADVV